MTAQASRIAIIGGGIGGLTLAVALRQRGIAADVYEQARELTEIGAAVALSANSTRELRRLGILDALTAVSTEPSELIYRNWRDGSRIAAHIGAHPELDRLRIGQRGQALDGNDAAERAGAGIDLESSIGAAAHLHVFASLRELQWGCEHFGPQILVEDLVTEPLRFEDFHIHLSTGPGLGVTLDQDKLRRFARN